MMRVAVRDHVVDVIQNGAHSEALGILHVSDFDADSPVRALGMTAAKIFGVALAAGALIPLFGKGRPQLVNLLLTVHVGAALAAFVATLMFVRQV